LAGVLVRWAKCGSRRDGADEAIAASVHGLNELGALWVIAQRAPYFADTDHQHHLTDGDIWPYGIEQGRFGEQLAGVFDQIAEDRKSLRAQGNRLGTAPQPLTRKVEAKRREDETGLRSHNSDSQENCKKIEKKLKNFLAQGAYSDQTHPIERCQHITRRDTRK
jgi:hypothetical protein